MEERDYVQQPSEQRNFSFYAQKITISCICNQLYPLGTLFSVSSSLCVPTSNSLITMLKLSLIYYSSSPFLYTLAVYEADNLSALLQFPTKRAPRVWLKFNVFIN